MTDGDSRDTNYCSNDRRVEEVVRRFMTKQNNTDDTFLNSSRFEEAVKRAVNRNRNYFLEQYFQEQKTQTVVDSRLSQVLHSRVYAELQHQVPGAVNAHLNMNLPQLVRGQIDTFLPVFLANDSKIRECVEEHRQTVNKMLEHGRANVAVAVTDEAQIALNKVVRADDYHAVNAGFFDEVNRRNTVQMDTFIATQTIRVDTLLREVSEKNSQLNKLQKHILTLNDKIKWVGGYSMISTAILGALLAGAFIKFS